MKYGVYVNARQRQLDSDIDLALNEIVVGPLGPFMQRFTRNLPDGSISLVLMLKLGNHKFAARSVFPDDADADAVFKRCDHMTRAMSNLQYRTAEALRKESAA